MLTPLGILAAGFAVLSALAAPEPNVTLEPGYNGLTGYFHVSPSASPSIRNDGWGSSMYSAVYPLKPGKDDFTQLGWGTWMSPNPYEDENGVWDERPRDEDDNFITFCSPGAALPEHFQSNEGGVGTWGNVQYPVAQPMFLIAATADCYTSGVGGPAYRPGGDEPLDERSLYFAQLSNRVLLPPGPLVFEQPKMPLLFGYGWIALPIIPAGASPYGIPTGTNSWTLFFHAENFKGPVGFFTPAFWTALNEPQDPWLSIGYGLDTRNSIGGSLAMEIGFTNAFTSTDGSGNEYRRVPRLTFGADENRRAILVQDFNRYFKSAVWDGVEAWLNGGPAALEFNQAGIWKSVMQEPDAGLRMLDGGGDRIALGTTIGTTVFTTSGGGSAFALQWDETAEAGVIPEYYRKVDGIWTPVRAAEVPESTGLAEQTFPELPRRNPPPLDVSETSVWSSSTWAAGPFTTALSNGSVIEYVWYRFVDQPAIARLPLSEADRARLQAWAESVHDQGVDGLTIPPPTSGQLASIDRGELVLPPPGLTRGYVPIAISQTAIQPRRRATRR